MKAPTEPQFDLSLIKKTFNPALIYAFDPEGVLDEKSSQTYQMQHASGQFQDMLNAYHYAQEVVLPTIKDKGIENISTEQFIEFIHQLHARIASTLAKDHKAVAGTFATSDIFRWHFGTAFSAKLARYMRKEISAEEFFPPYEERGLSKKEINAFIRILRSFKPGNEIDGLLDAVWKNKLSTADMAIVNKIVKVGTPLNEIPKETKEFVEKLKKLIKECNPKDDNAVAALAYFAFNGFVQVHPYFNGNGRLATLLMNIVLVLLVAKSILLRYPKEKSDPQSEYAIAIVEIDTQPDLLKKLIKSRLKNSAFEDTLLRKAVTSQVNLYHGINKLKARYPEKNIDKLTEVTFNKYKSDPFGIVSSMAEHPEFLTRSATPFDVTALGTIFTTTNTLKDLTQIMGAEKSNVSKTPSPNLFVKSDKTPDPHEQVIAEAKALFQADAKLQSYLKAIEERQYCLALRKVCGAGLEKPIRSLLKYHAKLGFNINEPSDKNGYTALDWLRAAKGVDAKVLAELEKELIAAGAKSRFDLGLGN